jgi:probable rRNA maturation factor
LIEIDMVDRQGSHGVDSQRLVEAARHVLQTHGVTSGQVSIAVLDNDMIHELNRKFLDHDYATDVLSFVLERENGMLEGEIAVSAEMAAEQAGHYGWPAAHELLLYVVHGALHLAGLDDKQPESLEQMRSAEQRACEWLGIGPPPHRPLQNPGPGDETTS